MWVLQDFCAFQSFCHAKAVSRLIVVVVVVVVEVVLVIKMIIIIILKNTPTW